MGAAAVVAPFVAIIPPHAVWLIGALGAGAFLAGRRWTERFTLVAVRGACPKCGAALQVKAARLRRPHAIACESCHHSSTLQLPGGALESVAEPA